MPTQMNSNSIVKALTWLFALYPSCTATISLPSRNFPELRKKVCAASRFGTGNKWDDDVPQGPRLLLSFLGRWTKWTTSSLLTSDIPLGRGPSLGPSLSSF
jgi:hypothetical protein